MCSYSVKLLDLRKPKICRSSTPAWTSVVGTAISESPESKIATEIDGETYHNPSKVSENKYADNLLKQNSLIYDNWKVYRWIYSQLEKQPEKVKDELITFLGTSPMFKAFEADLPVQMGQTIELRDYQQEATENLQKMREDGKTIALLYHATGVGETITAATDAKAVGNQFGLIKQKNLLWKCLDLYDIDVS